MALLKSGSKDVEALTEWLFSHEEEPPSGEIQSGTSNEPAEKMETNKPEADTSENLVAKSIKCDTCGKLFSSDAEVEFHAAKSGHDKFSHSTEEKKPLSEEEKKEQLAKIEAKLKQRRLEREAREKQEELEREKSRIKSGKDLLEAKKKHDEIEMKKILEQRKREKEEEKMARQRVKDQIEQDKLARKAKFAGNAEPMPAPPIQKVASPPSVASRDYNEVRLQIRLTNGSVLQETFKAKEPLSAVKLYIEMNRTDPAGPFSLMTSFPKKVFDDEDYDKPLHLLGLAPSAVIIVTKIAA